MSIELNQVDHREFQLGKIDIKEYDINADRIIRLPLDKPKQEVTINPSIESQVVTPESGKELSKVIVNPVDSTIDSNIIPRNIRAGVSVLGIDGDLQPDKPDQEKTVVPTKERQEVIADSGYELAKTIVEPIPDEYIIPEGTLDIANNGTYDIKSYENVVVSVGGENRFAKLVSGEDVEILESDLGNITDISSYAFYSMNNLISIELPQTITTIGDYAFNQCINLLTVMMYEGVTSIGKYAFANCNKLQTITLPSTIQSIGKYAFSSCYELQSISIPPLITIIDNNTFAYCRKLTTITIPDNITSIGQSAFSNSNSLKTVVISDSVTSIGNYAFESCHSLTDITLSKNITTISQGLFYGCDGLQEIIIPAKVTSISTNSFFNARQLGKMTLEEGSQLTSIAKNTFGNNSYMKLFDFRGLLQLPTLGQVLPGTTDTKIILPDALYEEALSANIWSSMSARLVKASEYVE